MKKIILLMALFTAILFSGAFTPSSAEITKLNDTLTQLKSKDDATLKTNGAMIDKILSSHNVTGGYENENYRYIYYMNLNATDKLAVFVITEIKNSEYGFIKALGMQKDFIMLIDANAPNKLVWSGYAEDKVLPEPASPIEYADKTAFITIWDTTKEGNTSSNQIKITTNPDIDDKYNYDIDWGDGQNDTSVTSDIIHTYDAEGNYTVSITGDFPAIYFYSLNVNLREQKYEVGDSDNYKLISIEQWGTQEWKSMRSAFVGCENMVGNSLDIPNLSSVNDMSYMFQGAKIFNQDISNWDVSNINIMAVMFNGANEFNQNINDWDVSNVNIMFGMFYNAKAFNQPLDNWDVSSVTNMNSMLRGATSFNQDLSGWNVDNVTDHGDFMQDAGANAIEPIWKD